MVGDFIDEMPPVTFQQFGRTGIGGTSSLVNVVDLDRKPERWPHAVTRQWHGRHADDSPLIEWWPRGNERPTVDMRVPDRPGTETTRHNLSHDTAINGDYEWAMTSLADSGPSLARQRGGWR